MGVIRWAELLLVGWLIAWIFVSFVTKLPLPYQVKRSRVSMGAFMLMAVAFAYGWTFGEPQSHVLQWVLLPSFVVGCVPLWSAARSAKRDGLALTQMGWLAPLTGIVLLALALAMFIRVFV